MRNRAHKRRDETLTLRTQQNRVAGASGGEYPGELHRGSSDCIATRPVLQLAGKEQTGMDPGLELEWQRQLVDEPSGHLAHSRMQLYRRTHGTEIVVLVSDWNAEQANDLFAERMVHEPAMPLRHLRRNGADPAHDLLQLRSREVFDQRPVIRQPRHEHRGAP